MENRQVHENELLIPALRIIYNHPEIGTTELIKYLEQEVELYPKDKEILKGRSDSYFSQTVRNLCGSHLSTNEFGKCVSTVKNGQRNSFIINDYGKELIDNNFIEEVNEIASDEYYQKQIEEAPVYDEIGLIAASNRTPILENKTKTSSYKKDPKIAKTVLKEKNYKCEYASLCGIEHKTFITKTGVEFQEGHHLIPMKAQKDFDENLDRPENIISLCPVCHRAIHNACKTEKIKILEALYKERIKKLEECNINISFEDLFNKYYL